MESHPANEMADLRLDRPFPGLVRYMDAMDLDSMDKQVAGLVSVIYAFKLP